MFAQQELMNTSSTINVILGRVKGETDHLKKNMDARYNNIFKPCETFTQHIYLVLDSFKDLTRMLFYILQGIVVPLSYLVVSVFTFNLPQILKTTELFGLYVYASLLQTLCLMVSLLFIFTRTVASIGCGYKIDNNPSVDNAESPDMAKINNNLSCNDDDVLCNDDDDDDDLFNDDDDDPTSSPQY